MLIDLQDWLLYRTDIRGVTREMLIKEQIFLVGSIVESVTKAWLHGRCGDGYKGRTAYLCRHGVINAALQVDLNWLWDVRNRMHLFKLDQSEWFAEDYTNGNYNRARQTMNSLFHAVNAA